MPPLTPDHLRHLIYARRRNRTIRRAMKLPKASPDRIDTELGLLAKLESLSSAFERVGRPDMSAMLDAVIIGDAAGELDEMHDKLVFGERGVGPRLSGGFPH